MRVKCAIECLPCFLRHAWSCRHAEFKLCFNHSSSLEKTQNARGHKGCERMSSLSADMSHPEVCGDFSVTKPAIDLDAQNKCPPAVFIPRTPYYLPCFRKITWNFSICENSLFSTSPWSCFEILNTFHGSYLNHLLQGSRT